MPSKGLLSLLLGMTITASTGAVSAQTPVQGTPYTRIEIPITYTPLADPTVLVNAGSSQEAEVQLPFEFLYYGETFSALTAGNAGAISFETGVQIYTTNQTPGTASSLDAWIAPFWDSMTMHSSQGAHLAYEVGGTAPNRWITFEWKNLNHNFSSSAVPEHFNFQVRLFEGLAGRIEIDYGPRSGSPSFVSATMGMESPNSDQPVLFAPSNCTSSCQPTDYDALVGQRIVLVQDPGVELAAVDVRAPPFATLGVDTPVAVSVANLNGSALGPFTAQLLASPTSSGGGTPVGSLELSLAPYSTQQIDIIMNAPVSLGEVSFYLTLVVDSDNAVAEVDENNNSIVSADRVRFLPSRPDLSIEQVIVSETSVSAGSDVDVELRVRNAGSQPIGAGDVYVMMSTNTAISPQDVDLDRFTVDLAAAETVTVRRTVTIPVGANSGTYWIGGLADPENALGEVSEANNGRAALSSLEVTGGNLAIVTTALPTAMISRSYDAVVSAVGGGPDVSFQVTGGMLPPGIGLVGPTGELYGRAEAEGVYDFTVEATSGNQSDTADLSITVSDPDEPLTIVTRAVPAAVVGQEYMVPLRATGGANTGSLDWSATGLPAGFGLSSDGVLSGSAFDAGTSAVELTVTNGSETTSREVTLVVQENANLQIVPALLPTGVWNMPYSASITASGGVPPVTFLLELGELPDGLDLSTDGTISGTPTEVGRFRLVIKALDSGSGGIAATDVNTFELIIEDAPGFEIETDALPDAVVGEGYLARVAAGGGLAPLDWSLDGRLPEGTIAQIDPMSGDFVIIGTPSEAGSTNLLVSVVDRQGRKAQKAFVLNVREVMVDTAPKDEDDGGCGCASTGAPAGAGGGALLLITLVGLVFRRRR